MSETDRVQFGRWIASYHALAVQTSSDEGRLELGREIHDWLDGSERWPTDTFSRPYCTSTSRNRISATGSGARAVFRRVSSSARRCWIWGTPVTSSTLSWRT